MTDITTIVDGYIAAMIGGAQQQFPGHRFELASGPDAHHDRVRFAWTLTGDGRLQAVTGFLEPV
jgi:hypothetical protein